MKTKFNQEVLNSVANDNKALRVALVGLYRRQTETEQATKSVKDKNSRGFYPRDCSLLTSAAETVIKHGRLPAGKATEIRKRVLKYRRQVSEIFAEASAPVTAPSPAPAQTEATAVTA